MPNSCINELTVQGPKEEINRFVEAAKGNDDFASSPFSLQSLYPMPDHINPDVHGVAEAGGETHGENWYDWCTKHWGTKWDIIEFISLVRHTDEQVFFAFATANGPCDDAITQKIAIDFPLLKFHLYYLEVNTPYAGEAEWEQGQLVKESFNPHPDMGDQSSEEEDA